ncbi:hypothetical protein [Nostoc sp.]|uniref:hypothetical protein n=1 Tax=Nostoc sp. TaxID=1180 RepID=UPI002FF985A2
MRIESYEDSQLHTIKSLSLRVWSLVFDSIQKEMDIDVYRSFYPDGWRVSHLNAVESACTTADMKVWIAIDSDSTVSFVAVKLH